MSWGGGTDIVRAMTESINRNIPGRWPRLKIHLDLIRCLEDQDWDGYCEVEGEDQDFDAAMKQLHPEEE